MSVNDASGGSAAGAEQPAGQEALFSLEAGLLGARFGEHD
jgi:hypothetical protein